MIFSALSLTVCDEIKTIQKGYARRQILAASEASDLQRDFYNRVAIA